MRGCCGVEMSVSVACMRTHGIGSFLCLYLAHSADVNTVRLHL